MTTYDLAVALKASKLAHTGIGKTGSYATGKTCKGGKGFCKIKAWLYHKHCSKECSCNGQHGNKADFFFHQKYAEENGKKRRHFV